MITAAFKKLKVLQPDSQKKPLLLPLYEPATITKQTRKNEMQSPCAAPPPPPSPRKQKYSKKRSRSEPVKFTFSETHIKLSNRSQLALTIADNDNPPPPPLKKQHTSSSAIQQWTQQQKQSPVIMQGGLYETELTSGIAYCLRHLFTWKQDWWDNTLKQHVYLECTLIRHVHNIGNEGTYLPTIVVEPRKARLTFVTTEDKYWRVKLAIQFRQPVLVQSFEDAPRG